MMAQWPDQRAMCHKLTRPTSETCAVSLTKPAGGKHEHRHVVGGAVHNVVTAGHPHARVIGRLRGCKERIRVFLQTAATPQGRSASIVLPFLHEERSHAQRNGDKTVRGKKSCVAVSCCKSQIIFWWPHLLSKRDLEEVARRRIVMSACILGCGIHALVPRHKAIPAKITRLAVAALVDRHP